MKVFEFVLILIGMVFIFQIVKHRLGIRKDYRGGDIVEPRDDGEAERLRQEVRELKDRIQVLERITVDKENSLARQIEELRDRP